MRCKAGEGGEVAQDAEEDEDGRQQPEPNRGDARGDVVAAEEEFRDAEEDQARKEQDGERIHGPRGRKVALQQEMDGAEGAATGTMETRGLQQQALGDGLVFRRMDPPQ